MYIMSLAGRIFSVVGVVMICSMTGCVSPVGCGPCGARGPLAFNNCDGCGQCEGCGELYIDPWINEPADACDPCDRCGNYNGQSCGKCRSVFDGFASLWGYRCDPPCDTAGPCTLCGGGGCDGGCGAEASCGVEVGCGVEAGCGFEPACGCEPGCGCESCSSGGSSGGSFETFGAVNSIGSDRAISFDPDPTPAKRISTAKPSPEPYRPTRSRQIFKPRGTVAGGKAITVTR
jgi:hypothetical protein